MAELNQKIIDVWKKGMETIGSTASGIASNARYKVDVMNMVNRRRELMNQIAALCFELHQQGIELPESLEACLKEIDELDERSRSMRADYIERVTPAGVRVEPAAEDAADEPVESAAEQTEQAEQTDDEL